MASDGFEKIHLFLELNSLSIVTYSGTVNELRSMDEVGNLHDSVHRRH